MDRLVKFWSLTRLEKQLFYEASILFLLSTLCVRALAFRHIDKFLRGRWSDHIHSNPDRSEDTKLVDCSVSRTVRAFPWKNQCLSQSIAAFIMLRRRRIPAIVIAGVKVSEDSSLSAHAWVETGRGVIGGTSESHGFTALVRIGQRSADH